MTGTLLAGPGGLRLTTGTSRPLAACTEQQFVTQRFKIRKYSPLKMQINYFDCCMSTPVNTGNEN